MKQYVLISILAGIVILAFLSKEILSQSLTSKVEAMHESLTLEASKDYPKSIQALEQAYTSDKNDYLLTVRLGWLNYLAGNYAESKKYYEQAFTLSNKNSIEALLGETLPLSALNDWDGVAAAYKTILRTDSMNYLANLRLGQILLNRKRYQEARTYLENAFDHYPGSYEPNLSLGWAYYYLGNKEKAKSLLTTALSLSPHDTLATSGLELVK